MGYFTFKSEIVLILAVILRAFAITTRFEQELLSTSKKHRHNLGTLPIPEWELGLREAVYQALLNENKLQVKNLHEFIHAAPLLRRQNSATPFGDIVIMGRGQLYSAPGGFQLLQDYYSNDCDGCHNPPPRCERIPCENWKPQDHERLLALWTAKRIRHRDSQYGYRYEFEYKISPMSMVANERFVTRNGNFDYSVSGYTFVVRVDPQQTSHRFYRHPNQAYEFFDTFNSPTWTPSSTSNHDNNFYLPPPIPTIDEYNDPDPRKPNLPDSLYSAPDYDNKNKFTTERHINDKEFEDELFRVTTRTTSTKQPTGPISTTTIATESRFMPTSSKTFPTTVLTTEPIKMSQSMRTSSLPFFPTIINYPITTTPGKIYSTFTPSTSDYITRLTSNVEVSTRTTRGAKTTRPYPIYSSTVITTPSPMMSFEPSPTKTTSKFKFTTSRFKTTKNTFDFDIFGENRVNMNSGTTSGYTPMTILTTPTSNMQNNKNKKPNVNIEGTLQSDLFDNFEPNKLSTTKSQDRNVSTTKTTTITSTEPKTTSTTRMATKKTTTPTPTLQNNKNKKPNTNIEGTLQSDLFDNFEPKLPTTQSQDGDIFIIKTTAITSTEPETTTSSIRMVTNATTVPVKITTERKQSTTSFFPNDKVTRPTFYSTKAKTFSPFKTMVFSVPLTTSPTFTMSTTISILNMLLTTSASTKTSTKQKTFTTLPTVTFQNDLTSIKVDNDTISTPADIINTTQQKLFPTIQETSTAENSDLATTDVTSTSSKMFDITTRGSENVLTSTIPNTIEDLSTIPTRSIVTLITAPIFTIPQRTNINMVTQRTTKLSTLTKLPLVPLTETTKLVMPSAPTTPTNDFFTTTPVPTPTTQQIRPIATTMRSIYSTRPTNKLKPQQTYTTKGSNMRTSVSATDDFLFNKNLNDLPKVTKGAVSKDSNFYFDIFGETFATKSTTTTSKAPFKTKEIDDIFGKETENNKRNKIKVQSSPKPKNEPEIIYADFYSPSTINYNKYEKFDETTKLPNSNLFQKNESRPTEFEHLTSQSYITSVSYKVNKKNPITTETYDNIGTKFQEVSSDLNGNDNDITTKTNLSPTMSIMCNETNPQTNSTKSLDALALTVLNNAKSITYLNSNMDQTTPASIKYKRRNGYKLRKFRKTS